MLSVSHKATDVILELLLIIFRPAVFLTRLTLHLSSLTDELQ